MEIKKGLIKDGPFFDSSVTVKLNLNLKRLGIWIKIFILGPYINYVAQKGEGVFKFATVLIHGWRGKVQTLRNIFTKT